VLSEFDFFGRSFAFRIGGIGFMNVGCHCRQPKHFHSSESLNNAAKNTLLSENLDHLFSTSSQEWARTGIESGLGRQI
jgi:hypothetical protein